MQNNKKVIGIAGTAKNAGKTTAITAILSVLRKYKKTFCITGIGYDGEDIDNITSLPKPRIFIRKGECVATAEKCINNDFGAFEIIERTKLFTPLGEIFIGVALKDTMLVAVGPNKISDLKKLIDLLNCEYILVDGALNRVAPMSEVDNIIISIGASQSENIDVLANTAKSIEKILSIKKFGNENSDIEKLENKNITFLDYNFNRVFESDYSSILVDEDINFIDNTVFQKSKYMYVPGAVSSKSILELLKKPYQKNNFTLIIDNPIALLSSADAITICNTINTFEKNGIIIKALKTILLIAITVNPFYPKYDFKTRLYTEDHIDASLLLNSVKQRVSVPVFDIVKYGSESIESLFI